MDSSFNTDSTTTTTWSSQQKGKYHGRGRPEGHIPRPPNAFMLFRSDFLSKFPPSVTQQDKSRIAGMCWRQLPQAEVTQWTELAKEVKEAHYRKYPDFKYKPTPKGPVKRRRQARTREQQLQDCESLLIKIMPDKAGLIPQSSEPVPRRGKRKASHKSRASPQPSPHDSQEVVASGSTIPQPAQVFMDPLIPPPPENATSSSPAASSSNYAQQEEELWTSGLSLPTLDPVTHPFLTNDTPAPPPEDWGRGGYSPSALQSILDALEQPTEPAAPLDLFEGTQCDPSGVLPLAFSQQGQTYTFPLAPPPHVYTSTFEWQKGVDQSHLRHVTSGVVESTQSAGVLRQAPPPPHHVLERLCHDFSYGPPHAGPQHLYLHQQQVASNERTASMGVAPEQESGRFAGTLDMRMDLGANMGMGSDFGMGMVDFGMGMVMGDSMSSANAYRAAAVTEWIVSAPVCDLVQVNNTPTS